MKKWHWPLLGLGIAACSTSATTPPAAQQADTSVATADLRVRPVVVTEPTLHDTDDPAIWVNQADPAQSLVLGTDKNVDGALYVYDLNGKILQDRVVRGLQRPNNVDLEYGLMLGGKPTDIAVVTERLTHKLRIFRLPDMQPVDGGGVEMFVDEAGEGYRDLMGIGLYKQPQTGEVYAIVGRKTGPTDGTYLWQYRLYDDGTGRVAAELVRKFGTFSGRKEIESIAVDDALGYVYFSDETVGVRQYHADPTKGNEELARFATEGFAEDHEGISIYPTSDSTGYILVSDQQANQFQVFTREGTPGHPYEHRLVKVIPVSTNESDGSEVTAVPLNAQFQHGLFVAMSDDRTFQFYRWEDLMSFDTAAR
ncbi:3-phytase [Catalinimonas alkaloidigena]|uniref:3-phytase n=1 Tax=Catalinimonas alkaloidigena TaxID=1075417 RepID=A0A1G9P153_9BACT|nr:phytase [Catalinimonas alkaloidigena]SDL92612.1 3-phytase [Catalinimonas alkaloidigena]